MEVRSLPSLKVNFKGSRRKRTLCTQKHVRVHELIMSMRPDEQRRPRLTSGAFPASEKRWMVLSVSLFDKRAFSNPAQDRRSPLLLLLLLMGTTASMNGVGQKKNKNRNVSTQTLEGLKPRGGVPFWCGSSSASTLAAL